ncbi:MAG: glycoside hydrolase family 15 protein [Pseudomonadota bacterium]|nr:glycoside hydrolase family 15 protein [Pseudomonadota bacterium]
MHKPPGQADDDSAGRWPAIGDYALIGDCRTAALVGLDGSIDWLCLPDFSSPAFFARILDLDRGGRFLVAPAQQPSQAQRTYVGDSNVLQTRFASGAGELVLTDAMVVPPALEPGQLLPQRELLRSVEAIGTEVAVEVIYQPRPDYARANVRLSRRAKCVWACEHGAHLLLLHSDMPLELDEDGRGLRGRCVLQAGERRYLSATYVNRDVGVLLPLGDDASARIDATVAWWEEWSGRCTYDGPYRAAVVRSALVLKLLTYCLSGSVIAAPTASLPEDIGGSRNWDYRYCWLRDASLTLEAFTDLGYQEEADAFLGWLLHSTRLTWPKLKVLYDTHGSARIPECTLDHLQGYRGSSPVRIGNGAWNQLQLDVYGSVVMAAANHVMRGGQLGRQEQKMLLGFGKSVCQLWRCADDGIWEIRDRRSHYTYSKVACWAALDCLVKLGASGKVPSKGERFAQERDAIGERIEKEAFDRDIDSYTGVLDSDPWADASLLLLPRYGYCKPDHPRMVGTFAYLDAQLSCGPLMYRYPKGSDGMEGEEHPFGICSFWAVDYLAQAGREDEARSRLEKLLAMSNDVGLYAEEIEPESGAAVGNFPQAFTHVGLINAAVSLSRCRKKGDEAE